MLNYGDPRLPESFWKRVSPEPNTGCWLWDGSVVERPEGNIGVHYPNKRLETIHRYAFRTLVAELGEDRKLTSPACGVSECCNPDHRSVTVQMTSDYDRVRAERRKRQRDKDPSLRRRWKSAQLKYQYGISVDDFDDMYRSQGGTCKICKTPFESKGSRRACVDHCHKGGQIRGLLCVLCNAGIGHFSESVELIEAAAEYVRNFSQIQLPIRLHQEQAVVPRCSACGSTEHNCRNRHCPARRAPHVPR